MTKETKLISERKAWLVCPAMGANVKGVSMVIEPIWKGFSWVSVRSIVFYVRLQIIASHHSIVGDISKACH